MISNVQYFYHSVDFYFYQMLFHTAEEIGIIH